MPATLVPATTNKVTGSLTATCAGGVMVKQPTYEPQQPRHTHQRHNDLMDAPTAHLKPRPTVAEKARNASITKQTITNYAQTAT